MRLIDADALREWVENWLYKDRYYHNGRVGRTIPITELYDILEQIPIADVAEAQQWIPVTERLPEEAFGCLVTVMDTEPMTCEEFENILPYFVGWDGEQWNDADGQQCPFEVLAWMPLPEPFKGEV